MRSACIVLLLLGLALCVAVVVVGRVVAGEPVYTLAEVQQGRLRQPSAWVGRTLLVRGQFVTVSTAGCPVGKTTRCLRVLHWEEIRPSTAQRPMRPGTSLPRLIVVRAPGVTGRVPINLSTLVLAGFELASRIPLVGQLVPASVANQGMVYRVRLLPVRRCVLPPMAKPCAEAVLLQVGA
jgi:hypothetical protein